MKKPVYSLGDIIDRMSILSRKIYFGDEQSISEHRFLEKGLDAYGIDGKLVTNIIRVSQMNFEIWSLEHELRKDTRDEIEYDQEELATIGKKSLRIRDINKKRVEYKNLLNQVSKTGFKESKIRHRSAA